MIENLNKETAAEFGFMKHNLIKENFEKEKSSFNPGSPISNLF